MTKILTLIGVLVLVGAAAYGGYWFAKSGKRLPVVDRAGEKVAAANEAVKIPETPAAPASAAPSSAAAPAGATLPVATQPSAAERAANVLSGDTLRLASGRTVQLAGVCAPRQGEAYFAEVREALVQMVGTAPLSVELLADGKALVWRGGALVNEQLVRSGMSRTWNGEGGSALTRLKAAENAAKTEGKGYWSPAGWMGARP